jgi:hypothetical protein
VLVWACAPQGGRVLRVADRITETKPRICFVPEVSCSVSEDLRSVSDNRPNSAMDMRRWVLKNAVVGTTIRPDRVYIEHVPVRLAVC